MRTSKKYMVIPLLILVGVIVAISLKLHAQGTVSEHSPEIINSLLWILGIIGSGFLGIVIFLGRKYIEEIKGLRTDIDKINNRCIAYHPEIVLGQRHE